MQLTLQLVLTVALIYSEQLIGIPGKDCVHYLFHQLFNYDCCASHWVKFNAESTSASHFCEFGVPGLEV